VSDAEASGEKVNRIERRKQEFRDKITSAAIKLFEKQGISETSVASIIKEADIAHKTFFNHFPTKDHLLQHIASSFSGNAYESFREDFKKQSDPSRRLKYCLMSVAKALEHVSPHYKELLNFYLISGAGSSEMQQDQKQQFTAVIAQIMEEAGEQNALKATASAQVYTDMTVGICVATLLDWSLQDNYDIVGKMKAACDFLNQSIFSSPS